MGTVRVVETAGRESRGTSVRAGGRRPNAPRGLPLIRRREGWARTLSCCWWLALVSGCGAEPEPCTMELRFPLTGDVYDRDGNGIVPDRVTVAYPESVVHECEIEPPSLAGSRFRCVEGNGTGVLTAYYGDQSVEKSFEVRQDEHGCHALEQEVDLKFE